ncbi:hypothetical protein DFH29DRAFT_871771 [Suillus ampliporus]|nr:hypothetical protein DFH29DRAFT_871771 [Suillus ampliporus]
MTLGIFRQSTTDEEPETRPVSGCLIVVSGCEVVDVKDAGVVPTASCGGKGGWRSAKVETTEKEQFFRTSCHPKMLLWTPWVTIVESWDRGDVAPMEVWDADNMELARKNGILLQPEIPINTSPQCSTSQPSTGTVALMLE